MYESFTQQCERENFEQLWAETVSGDCGTVTVTGDTYRHRAAIRAMGGDWDKAAQCWRVPGRSADAARKLRGVVVR